jgi:hypothetical protein
MPDTGAPWNIPYVAPTDNPRVYPAADEAQALAIAAGLDEATIALGPNVVQTVKTDTFSASVGAGAATDVTGLSVSITPTSATSKVLVMWDLSAFAPAVGWSVLLKRAGTGISVGDAASGLLSVTAFGSVNATNGRETGSGSGMVLDSPGTASSVTYQLAIANPSNGSQTLLVNRNSNDDRVRAASRITVIEVAA